MHNGNSDIDLLALARSYLGNRLMRHPERYLEIVEVLRTYRLQYLVLQLGIGHRHDGDFSANKHLNDVPAENLASALEVLGTCFIKLGQLMSTRPDFLPAHYITALSRLQDTVTPTPAEQITQIIERELGAPLTELFRDFDCTPLATASIAQVHKATLHDGSPVVVKVLRPGVRRQVEIDLEVMQEVARFATRYTPLGTRFGLLQMAQELKQSLRQELDFVQEAENTQLISQGIREFEHLTTPQVYREYSAECVLTLNFLPGHHLEHIDSTTVQRLNGPLIAQELFSAYLKQMVVNGIFHCDPHPGNILLSDDGCLSLLDFGMVGRLDAGQKDQVILMLLAFAERQGTRVSEAYLDMIEVPESLDRRAFTQEVSSLVSRYHDMSQGHMEIGRALLDLTLLAQTHQVAVPSSLTLLGKTMLNLDGTLRILAPDLNPVQVIHNYLEHIMKQQVQKQVSAARIYTWLLDTRHLVEQMPRHTDVVIEKLAHDQFTMHLKIDHLGTILDRAAKRISFGMIIASLILSIGLYFQRKLKGN